MTDQERIWIDDERKIGGSVHVYDTPDEGVLKYCTEYVRADLSNARMRAVAEAVREAAAASLEERGSDGWAENVMAEYASVNAEAIRSLDIDAIIEKHGGET